MTFTNKSDTTDPYTLRDNCPCIKPHHRHGISWSAIFTGSLIAVGLSFILNLFAVAIGLTAFVSNEGSTSIAISSYVGVVIGVIVIMFISGFVSGHLGSSCCSSKCMGTVYGFATWVLSLIIVIVFASAFTQFVASYYHSLFGPNYSIKTTAYPSTTAASSEKSAVADVSSLATTAKKEINAGVREASTNNVGDVNVSKVASAVEQSLYATFFIFLIGAIASTLGGYFGLCCACCRKGCCKEDKCEIHPNTTPKV